ncbi:caspase, EACC1-associated type [Saccharothrix sp. Mg75]|uniref:caspase, EACC1-associated type n=1 Tax=Saccharothrix sp. Mg75 TaxID=3445357 RepID=UPI003EEEB700
MGRYALLVATGEYEDVRLSRLRAPSQDVERLAAVLADPGVGGFTSVEVLRDRADHEVRRAVEELLAPRTPDDLVLLYFSCHGLTTPARRLYFATANTVQDRPAGTAVPRTFVNEQLEDCRASGRVLVLDCCFSGAFVEGFKAGEADVLGDPGSGYVVMTASNAYEYAFEQDSLSLDAPRASLFTDVLIDGLASGGADLDGDGWIGVDELFRYAHDGVRARRADQTPQYFAHGASGALRIARAGGAPVRSERRAAAYTSGQLLVARGFRAAAGPVCRTLGPMGRRAVVFVDRRPVELGDASAIAAAFTPDDPADSLGASYVRELVDDVRREAGDGAASAVAVARGALDGLVGAMRDGHDPVRLLRGVEAAAARALDLVAEAARPLEEADVTALATASAGDPAIGELVGRAVRAVGRRGPVVVEAGTGAEPDFEVTRGLRLDRGHASGAPVRHPVLTSPAVVLVAGRPSVELVRGLVDVPDRPQLLVLCELVTRAVLAEVARLAEERPLALVAVAADLLERARAVVGGTVLDARLPASASPLAFGRADRVLVTAHDTTILGGAGVGSYSAAVVHAPATTAPLVERAVRAVRTAAFHGVVRGGGAGLRALGDALLAEATGTAEEVAGWRAFARALGEPAERIAENAALTVADLDPTLLDSAGTAHAVVAAAARTATRFLLVG